MKEARILLMFTFQQFAVHDEHCAMKVGTDGVLLGAWAHVEGKKKLVDVGCGSGLIALMAAQRASETLVVGIEIDEAAVGDAQRNAAESPFAGRLQMVHADALAWAEQNAHGFDYVLSNPPYHEETLLPPSATRAKARHTEGGGLTFPALLVTASLLLEEGVQGPCIGVILPATAVPRFVALSAAYGFELVHRTDVVTRPTKPAKRVLLEFSRMPSSIPLQHDRLVLVANDGGRTEEYERLCGDFYLKKDGGR